MSLIFILGILGIGYLLYDDSLDYPVSVSCIIYYFLYNYIFKNKIGHQNNLQIQK